MAIIILFLMILFTGCKKEGMPEEYKKDAIDFSLKKYKIEDKGFNPLIEKISKQKKLPDLLTIGLFKGDLTKQGYLESFTLNVYAYNEKKECQGMYGINYFHDAKKISIIFYLNTPTQRQTMAYNTNNEIGHLNTQVMRLPLGKQIKMVKLKRYVLSYSGSSKLGKEQTIMDGSSGKEFPVLTMEEYKNGEGGYYDGHTSVIFTLSDGTSSVSEYLINYVCSPADVDSLYGDREFRMEYDYYVNNNQMFLSRDYGETWIQANISEEDMAETLAFYNIGVEIPQYSYSISSESDTIAFFYGASPSLCISKDNGITWSEIDFGEQAFGDLSVTQRIVHFFNENEGYVGLGSGWSMGTGEAKYCMTTQDGGDTWHEYALPLSNSSSILTGLRFSDMNNGIVSLKSPYDNGGYPLLYGTEDGGATWNEIHIPWEQLPEDVYSLSCIDSLTYENCIYTLTLSEGEMKSSFKSELLREGFSYLTTSKAVIHTVG